MMLGRGFWILVWYGLFALGAVGLWAAVAGGRRVHWQNLDELLRGIGTMLVSAGMLLILYGRLGHIATGLMGLALGVFVAAFVAGRNLPAPLPDEYDDETDEHPALRASGPQRAVGDTDSPDPERAPTGATPASRHGGLA